MPVARRAHTAPPSSLFVPAPDGARRWAEADAGRLSGRRARSQRLEMDAASVFSLQSRRAEKLVRSKLQNKRAMVTCVGVTGGSWRWGGRPLPGPLFTRVPTIQRPCFPGRKERDTRQSGGARVSASPAPGSRARQGRWCPICRSFQISPKVGSRPLLAARRLPHRGVRGTSAEPRSHLPPGPGGCCFKLRTRP